MTGQGFGLPAPLPALLGRRKQDLPSSRQILSMHALLPSDPGGTGTPGLFGVHDVAFREWHGVGSHD
jgi:hypothetical protein